MSFSSHQDLPFIRFIGSPAKQKPVPSPKSNRVTQAQLQTAISVSQSQVLQHTQHLQQQPSNTSTSSNPMQIVPIHANDSPATVRQASMLPPVTKPRPGLQEPNVNQGFQSLSQFQRHKEPMPFMPAPSNNATQSSSVQTPPTYVPLSQLRQAQSPPVHPQNTQSSAGFAGTSNQQPHYASPLSQAQYHHLQPVVQAGASPAAMGGHENFGFNSNERVITIFEALQKKGEEQINLTCSCKVIEMEPEQPVHPLVNRPRRKICIGDNTGVMIGFIKRPNSIHFEKGDTIRLSHFTMRDKEFIIHSGTKTSV